MTTLRIDQPSSSVLPEPLPADGVVPQAEPQTPCAIGTTENQVDLAAAERARATADVSPGERDLQAIARSVPPHQRLELAVTADVSAEGIAAGQGLKASITNLDERGYEVKLELTDEFGLGREGSAKLKALLGSTESTSVRFRTAEGAADFVQAAAQVAAVEHAKVAVLGPMGTVATMLPTPFTDEPRARMQGWLETNPSLKKVGGQLRGEAAFEHHGFEAKLQGTAGAVAVIDTRVAGHPKLRIEAELSAEAEGLLGTEAVRFAEAGATMKLSGKLVRECDITPAQARELADGRGLAAAVLSRPPSREFIELELEGKAKGALAVGGADATFSVKTEVAVATLEALRHGHANEALDELDWHGEGTVSASPSQLHFGVNAEVLNLKADVQRRHVTELNAAKLADLKAWLSPR